MSDKPKFDPNAPFEAADKPKFDPNQPFDEAPKRDVSMLESGLRGAAQGLSLGTSDEITAGLESAFTDKTYDQALYEAQKANQEARDANPVTYYGSNIAGGVATSFVPGLNIAKGASALAAGAKLAGIGAVSGFAGTDGTVDQRIKGGLTGAALGGVTGVAGQALSKANLQNPVSKLADGAEDVSLAAASAVEKGARGIRDNTQGWSGWAAKSAANVLENPVKESIMTKGEWASKLLQKASAVADPALNKFAPVLQSAAQRGSQAVSATHYLLQQKDPEYREFIKRNEESP